MLHFEDAKSLVVQSREQFNELKNAYKQSLIEKTVKRELLIKVKNLMENLRSALDFTAHGLFIRYCAASKTKQKIYFPYALDGESRFGFQKKGIIEKSIPGLNKARPDIVAKIESFQSFANTSNKWLPQFVGLCNTNKHQQLTPQVRKERKQLVLGGHDGPCMIINEGAKVFMGPGAVAHIGGLIIPGNQKIDVNNPPITFGSGRKEVIIWVSFHFEANHEEVISFLEKCLSGVDNIVKELSKL